jgi:hypothetical protein
VKKLLFAGLIAILLVLPLAGTAGDGPGSISEALRNSGASICTAVMETIQGGAETRAVVRTALELGHSACMVVKCSIEGGGDLEGTMAGAVEAGARPDVVARCAIDVGADREEVARILSGPEMMLSICYFPPEGEERDEGEAGVEFADAGGTWDPFPEGDRWQNLSPHTF